MIVATMATITTTYLEMCRREELIAKAVTDDRFTVQQFPGNDWRLNRQFYLTVGQSWAWNDKRSWSDSEWQEYASADGLQTFVAQYDGQEAGYYELFLHADDSVEIAYFGLLPRFVGRGLGGALLTSALTEAWNMDPPRVWVHTCTLDHPSALANYQARGMKIYRVETHGA